MKNKSVILVLTVLITAICLFYLSFTMVSRGIQKDTLSFADEQVEIAKAASEKINLDSLHKASVKQYRDSMWTEEVYMGYTYEEVKKFELNLGLDLQGGMHITLIVSPVEIIKAMSGDNEDPAFINAIEKAQIEQRSRQEKFTTLFYEAWTAEKGEGKLWEAFLTSDNNNTISSKSTDDDILKVLNTEMDNAIDRTMIVLRSRIDKFGATQPVIQDVKSTGRIEIQLPGADDEERIVRQVKAVAELEFLEVWDVNQVFPYYQAINDVLVKANALEEAEANKSETATPVETEQDQLFADEEGAEVDSSATEEDESMFADTEEDSADVAASEDTVQQNQAQPITDYIIASQYGFYADSKNYDKVQALLNTPDVKSIIPSNMTVLWGIAEKGQKDGIVPVYFVRKGENYEAPLNGSVITDARQTFDNRGQVAVSMQMNVEGAKAWEKLTTELAAKSAQLRRPVLVAISLDDVVYSAPRVNEPIPNGNSSISGNFDVQEATDLSNILKAGKLPAPTEIERMVVVGPSLGKEAIDRGLLSLIAGLALVIIFMIAYYAKGGVVANLALLFNIFFILGALSSPNFGATLTLPGIAGIVLTIGMSIDANVLIFERIREELNIGKPLSAAISNGYAKAFWTIFDSNLTTLITAGILAYFGSGLVKGFAVTLMIGIICSFFSAVFITRLFIGYMMGKKGKEISFSTGFSKSLFDNINIDFIGKRKVAYAFSIILIVIGMGSAAVKGGFNLGVAFKGGHQYIVKFDQDVIAPEVESALKAGFGEAGTEVKTFDGNNQLQITTSYRDFVSEDATDVDVEVKAALMKGLEKYKDLNPSIQQTIVVGPTIADDIKATSIQSIIVALVAIFLYIFIRFRKYQFGLGALVALFHDVLIVLSVFAIFRLIGISFEIDEVFIAAILTIVGYSINDTVVVFDRVRENLVDGQITKNIGEVLNQSLNATLSRTLMTSMTTLLVVAVLLIFGGEALRGFSFALFIGVLIGTYSSVFIATPVVMDTAKKTNA